MPLFLFESFVDYNKVVVRGIDVGVRSVFDEQEGRLHLGHLACFDDPYRRSGRRRLEATSPDARWGLAQLYGFLKVA